jgi:peptidoglycan hydrolase-like protein with peptidoglycan-binding domain
MVQRAFSANVVGSLVGAFLLIGGVMVAGAALRDDSASSPDARSATTTTPVEPTSTTSSTGASSASSTTTSTTLAPTTTTTIPALAQPSTATLPPLPLYGTIGPGYDPPTVQAYQQRLHDLKLDPGPVDGVYGQAMTYAVQAVQKIAGLEPTGRIGAAEKAALEGFQYPVPLHPSAEANRTEINIANQTITLYEGYQVKLVTTTSTASGETFCYVTPKAAPTQRICEVATTPNGRYTYYFFHDGWQDGDLGALYNPYYFFKGRAIHGYESVPTTPASHGCARIPMHIAFYWHALVHRGDAVYVDGGPANGEEIISSEPI